MFAQPVEQSSKAGSALSNSPEELSTGQIILNRIRLWMVQNVPVLITEDVAAKSCLFMAAKSMPPKSCEGKIALHSSPLVGSGKSCKYERSKAHLELKISRSLNHAHEDSNAFYESALIKSLAAVFLCTMSPGNLKHCCLGFPSSTLMKSREKQERTISYCTLEAASSQTAITPRRLKVKRSVDFYSFNGDHPGAVRIARGLKKAPLIGGSLANMMPRYFVNAP
ncbi:hypothetical protein M513_05897 [Trichuris suis]|uniref:Uncharacterized protein n=1 Tax=Trichuris suis TaxID=68888 RepID=A0A085M7J1_9BILA|nr:hypothetical protein M513_05897 [Trichuris suis]